jgi:hypothetical protein
MLGIFGLAEEPLASQSGLSYMELVYRSRELVNRSHDDVTIVKS